MKCPKCGNEVLSTDSHCSSCGAHFATIPQWRSCPKCGRANKSSNTECSFCHTLLDEQTVTIIPTPVKQPIENKPTPSAKQPVKKIPLSFEKQQGTQPTNVTQSNETLEISLPSNLSCAWDRTYWVYTWLRTRRRMDFPCRTCISLLHMVWCAYHHRPDCYRNQLFTSHRKKHKKEITQKNGAYKTLRFFID